MEAWHKGEAERGNSIQTSGGSPEVVVRSMLDQPAPRGTMLALTLVIAGQQACGGVLKVENFQLKPVSQQEDQS